MSDPTRTPTTEMAAYGRYTQALRDMRLAVQRGDMREAKRLADESLALERQHPEFVSNG